ncbi:MAG: glutamate ligase domain-containing protein, partial [Endomicrobiales bacterium]
LLGEHQARNCATALAAMESLSLAGVKVRWAAALKSLRNVDWQGRFDVREVGRGKAKKTVILDGAHNPQGIKIFLSTVHKSIWGRKKRTLIFGVLGDKDYRTMVSLLAPAFEKVLLVPVHSKRAVETDELKRQWMRHRKSCALTCAGSFGEAFEKTRGDRVVAVTGSLYLIGEALRELNERRG